VLILHSHTRQSRAGSLNTWPPLNPIWLADRSEWDKPRRKCNVEGEILSPGRPPRPCRVVDISDSGARLELTSGFGIADAFELSAFGNIYRARIVRPRSAHPLHRVHVAVAPRWADLSVTGTASPARAQAAVAVATSLALQAQGHEYALVLAREAYQSEAQALRGGRFPLSQEGEFVGPAGPMPS
jgi:hypothetical protein